MTIGSKLMMCAIRNCLGKLFGKTAKNGAQTTIHCACSKEVANQSGSYFEYDLIITFLLNIYICFWFGLKRDIYSSH